MTTITNLSDADLAAEILHHKSEHDRLVGENPKAAREHWQRYWDLVGLQMERKEAVRKAANA